MRRAAWPAGAAVLLIAAGVVALSGAEQPTAVAQGTPANTATVETGKLSAMVSQDGTLTYRARPDGSPFSAINHARGTYTRLPAVGEEVGCGDVLYRVDERPVLLLCGAVPAYRALHVGDAGTGRPPAQPQPARARCRRRLHRRGRRGRSGRSSAARAPARPGALALGDAVFLPEAVRIAKVTASLGGSARPGAPVLNATSGKLHVQVALDPSQQRQVRKGDRARITLPGNTPVSGRVERIRAGRRGPAGQDGRPPPRPSPPTSASTTRPQARGLDRAPVQVDITTRGVENALSVPVTAIVGRSGGGFAVEAVRAGGRRELVAVRLGLFDTAGGRVQVEGDVRAGDRVAVPSS